MYQVVCVDDEAFVLEDLKKAIDWFGYNMEIAFTTTDPQTALDYIQKNPVHLLVTDISMPQMMGTELIQKAKELNPRLFILVLSAYDTFEYVRSAMRGGAENYLLKPLDPEELSESVSQIVSHLDSRHKETDGFEPSTFSFRSNFVESWCRGTVGEKELIDRAQMLGVNLQLDNYTVVMFTVQEWDADKMPLLFDMLLSVLVGSYISHFYFESPDVLFCVISRKEGFSSMRFMNEIEKRRSRMDFSFFMSVGTTVQSYAEVSDSYHVVCRFRVLMEMPLTAVDCQYLLFPANYQQTAERSFLEVDREEYLNDMRRLLETLAPERRISMELLAASWAVSQTGDSMSGEKVRQLFQNVVCDKSNMEGILDFLGTLYEETRKVLLTREQSADNLNPYVRKVIERLDDFSDKDISLKTLAAQMNVHPSYLGAIFRQQTGYFFNDYLNEVRLKYAAKLIREGDIRIRDIADMAGFSSQTYFNRQFKNYFGVSPNAYRREQELGRSQNGTGSIKTHPSSQ